MPSHISTAGDERGGVGAAARGGAGQCRPSSPDPDVTTVILNPVLERETSHRP
jgi:hypothetical protein